MSYTRLMDNLKSRGYDVHLFKTGGEALLKIKELIPPGSSVMSGASATLEQIGFIDYLKSGDHSWHNLHASIVAEADPHNQSLLRQQALHADYYLGSVHALIETGEMLIASNTGSQLPHLVYTSPNLILVISTKKIVKDLPMAFTRLNQTVIPLEEKRMRQKYGVGTAPNKVLLFNGESSSLHRHIHILLIDEDLGF